jgi:hypothetical protein
VETPEGSRSASAWDEDSGGGSWHLELDQEALIPGQLVNGRVSFQAHGSIEARGVVVTLKAVEHWRWRQTQTTGTGQVSTHVVTSEADMAHEPVELHGALQLAAGESFEQAFQMPVPPDGPASLKGDDAGLVWTIEAKLDIADGLDSRIERPVTVVQPTALLRAGAVPLAELALYESADVADRGVTGTIALKPVPLVCGQPFSGQVKLKLPGSESLQEIRAELRVKVEATVSSGESETITTWAGLLAPAGKVDGTATFAISGTVPARPLPSIELPHGRASATFHVILAKAWAADIHLVRDVAIATTGEI